MKTQLLATILLAAAINLSVALDCHTCAPCELGEKGVNTTCPEMLNGYCQKTILAGIVTKNCMSKSPGLTNGCHGKDSDHQVCLCDNVDLCNSSESLHKQWVVLSVIIAAIAARIFNWKPKGAMETLKYRLCFYWSYLTGLLFGHLRKNSRRKKLKTQGKN